MDDLEPYQVSILWGQCVRLGMTQSEGIFKMEARLSRIRVEWKRGFPREYSRLKFRWEFSE